MHLIILCVWSVSLERTTTEEMEKSVILTSDLPLFQTKLCGWICALFWN